MFMNTVPIGAPLNLSAIVIDSRTVSFTWEEPLEQLHNGIIRQYHISISELDTGQQLQFVSTTNMMTIPSLHPNYAYEWSVAAFTVGEGPFSATQTISMPEDGTELYSINI